MLMQTSTMTIVGWKVQLGEANAGRRGRGDAIPLQKTYKRGVAGAVKSGVNRLCTFVQGM